MKSSRYEKVIAQLKREISFMIKDTLPEEVGIVSVSDIFSSGDFKEAKVYISVLDLSKVDQVIKILEKNKLKFQHTLGRKLKMKFTPKITFFADEYQEKLCRISEIMGEIDGS